MRKFLFLVVAVLLILPAGIAVAQQEQSQQEVLTNDDVIKMVKAELGEELVLLKVQTTPADFDLSIDGLILLKEASVPESVIKAMYGVDEPQMASIPNDKASLSERTRLVSEEGYLIPEDRGVYYLRDNELEFMEGVAPGVESGGGSAMISSLTFGAKKYKVYGVFRGQQSDLKITESQPDFVIKISDEEAIRDYVLVRLEEKRGERKFVIASGRAIVKSMDIELNSDDVVSTSYKRLASGVYQITMDANLSSGEYAFVDAGATFTENSTARAYDFSIVR